MNEILLYGTVGSSFWDEECFSAKEVREQLDGLSGPLTVRINSGGGIATEGQAIYAALRGYAGTVDVIIEGVAASAASLIAMAGDTITMTHGSLLMIHDPASWYVDGRGTEDDHLKAAKVLGTLANAYASIYARRAGITVEEARDIMRAETYFDGEDAVASGFATVADKEGDETSPAAFDYRIYQHAPQRLLNSAVAPKRARSIETVRAMLIGPAIGKLKGMTMKTKGKITASTAAPADGTEDDQVEGNPPETEDDPEADPKAEVVVITPDEEGDEGEGEEDMGEEENPSAPAEALAIYRMCIRSGLPQDRAEDFIARGLTCREAVAELNGKGDKVKTMNHAPRARILRDERETRRAAMSAAISAQIGRDRDVTGPARQYMNMTLIEMIAESIGHRGQLRSYGDRERVLMAASHSTSDFPAIFENALNKQLLERYQLADPTYRKVARQKNFLDFRPMPLVRTGDFPTLKPIGENGEIKWGTFGEGKETALISSYAVGLTISRQMMINDDLGAIDEVLSNYGMTIAQFEERTFYAAALAAVMSDGKTIFHADHGNLAATAAAIDTTSVSKGRAAMRKQKSIDGNSLNIAPNIILCGPDKETEAEMFVAQITPVSTADVNVFSGKLSPVVTAEITGNAWYLLSSTNPCWVYGFLDGAEAPRLRTEEPFGTQGFSMTLEHDFGFGAAEYRGGYKNAGA